MGNVQLVVIYALTCEGVDAVVGLAGYTGQWHQRAEFCQRGNRGKDDNLRLSPPSTANALLCGTDRN